MELLHQIRKRLAEERGVHIREVPHKDIFEEDRKIRWDRFMKRIMSKNKHR